MSGGAVAYHLRENKAIERNLFIEVLARVARVVNVSDYTYVGFGGPFLEDFKALHSALRICKMISIESDKNVCTRQAFNKPAAFIEIKNMASGEFLLTHEFVDGNIAWLDYEAPKDLYVQLSEFRSLVGKLGRYDIAKITLNANPSALGGQRRGVGLHEERRQELAKRLGDHCKFKLDDSDVLGKNYPMTLLRAIRSCLSNLAARASGEYFQPLSAFVYKDSGHQMLTVTGVILNAKDDLEKARFLKDSRFDHWPFCNFHWSPPIEISVPPLSAKERLALDNALPVATEVDAGDYLANQLGYCPSDQKNILTTKSLLANYAKFYRAYPLFSRVVL
jgi:hypothetical protein